MKHTLLFTLIVSCCLAMPVWESIGPYGGPLRTLALAPSNEDIIYVVSYEWGIYKPRMFRSVDGGNSWNETGIVSDSLYVYSLAVDPTNPDIVYAGSKQRVYKSTTAGASWGEHLVSHDSIRNLAVHPTTPSIVFALGKMEIGQDTLRPAFFKSTDGGTSWDSVQVDTINCTALSMDVDPSDPDIIYIGGRYRQGTPPRKPRIWKSTDGGSSFTVIYSDTVIAQVHAICVHPTNSDIIYAGMSAKIFRSTDAGASWSEMYGCSNTVFSLAVSPADTDVVYAGTVDSLVYKSTDVGVSWSETGPGLRGRYIYGLAVRSTDADLVYVASYNTFDNRNSGFFKTTDGGSSWFESSRGISLARIPGFDLSPSSPSAIYTQFYITRVYKTTNSGADWTELPGFNCVENIHDFAVHNANSDTVLCIEGPG